MTRLNVAPRDRAVAVGLSSRIRFQQTFPTAWPRTAPPQPRQGPASTVRALHICFVPRADVGLFHPIHSSHVFRASPWTTRAGRTVRSDRPTPNAFKQQAGSVLLRGVLQPMTFALTRGENSCGRALRTSQIPHCATLLCEETRHRQRNFSCPRDSSTSAATMSAP